MICARCELDLPPGAAHLSEAGCIEALKARSCIACKEPVLVHIHPGCVPAEIARRGASLGVKALEKRVLDYFMGMGQPKPEGRSRDRARPSPDAHFEP